MPKTLADHRDQARTQLADESIVAAFPALSYPYRNESLRFLERLLPVPRKASPRMLIFRNGRADLHTHRWTRGGVGDRIDTHAASDTQLLYVEDTREGSTRIEFGGERLTVLDEHMAALYDVARRTGFDVEPGTDPRAGD